MNKLKNVLLLIIVSASSIAFSLQNYFDVLQVSPFSTPEEIKKTYKDETEKIRKSEDPEKKKKLAELHKALKALEKPSDIRYHMYLLLENASEGRKPGLFEEDKEVALALFNLFKKAQRDDFWKEINIIDPNELIEKKYEKIKTYYESQLAAKTVTEQEKMDVEKKLKDLNESYRLLTQPWTLKEYVPQLKARIEAAQESHLQMVREQERQKQLKEEEKRKKEEEERLAKEERKRQQEEEKQRKEQEKKDKDDALKKQKEEEEYWKKFEEEHKKKMAEIEGMFKHKEAPITQQIIFERWPDATAKMSWVLELKNDASFPVFIESLKFGFNKKELIPKGSMLAIGASKGSSQKDKGYLRFGDQLFTARDPFDLILITKDESGKVESEFSLTVRPNLSRKVIFLTIDEKSKKDKLIIRPQSGKAKGLTGKSQSGVTLKDNVKKDEIKVQ